MKLHKSIVMAAGGFSLLAIALGGPASAADPTPSDTALVGVGSDTTQNVVDGLSTVIPGITNYDATPAGRLITTRTGTFSNPNCTFTAPANSGEGRDALVDSLNNTTAPGSGVNKIGGCVDFARSSSAGAPTSVTPGGLTYVPFAIDSVTFATLNVSNVPHNLTQAQLKALYSANIGSCGTLQPLLPKFNSGTRSFFVKTVLGLSDVTIGTAGGPGTCVKDVASDGVTPIEEHDGRFLVNANQLVPFSTAQYIAQSSGFIANQLGRATLGAIDSGTGPSSPLVLKTSGYTYTRSVYNVVGTNTIASNPAIKSTFVGTNGPGLANDSAVCQAQSTILFYGFALNPNCGSTSTIAGSGTP